MRQYFIITIIMHGLPSLPGDVIKARMRGGALYLPLKGMSLPIFFSVQRKKRRTEQKERRMAGKRLQMTFVTSEIWLRLLLAANGCSSHVTTSECTRGRGEERPRRRRARQRVTLHLRNTNSSDASPLRRGSEGKGSGGAPDGTRRANGPTANGVSVSGPGRGCWLSFSSLSAISDSRSVPFVHSFA